MEKAANEDTAAMIATVTDAYPTRPWCRREASLARTPALLPSPKGIRVWKIQPVVAVHNPASQWVRGAAAINGVPRIGWSELQASETTERIVDRLVLEVLLGQVHRRVAVDLENKERTQNNQLWKKSCYITWVPDEWTLLKIRSQLGKKASSIVRIVYPGYGLSETEMNDLRSALDAFSEHTSLVSFEKAIS